MLRNNIFSDEKIDALLSKYFNNPQETSVSEKLILIGNLSETVHKGYGSLQDAMLRIKEHKMVKTGTAPATVNALLTDLYVALTGYCQAETMKEKYDHLNIMAEFYQYNLTEPYQYEVNFKVTNEQGSIGRNTELAILIENLNLDLIIKVYILVLSLSK